MKSTKLCNYLLCVAVVFRNVLSQAFPGQIHVFRCLTFVCFAFVHLKHFYFSVKNVFERKTPYPISLRVFPCLSQFVSLSLRLPSPLSLSPSPFLSLLFTPSPRYFFSVPLSPGQNANCIQLNACFQGTSLLTRPFRPEGRRPWLHHNSNVV